MAKGTPQESESGYKKHGVNEHDHEKDEPRKREHNRSRDAEDNRVHTLIPDGLPKTAQKDQLIYDWDKTKGRERNVRDPVHKPKALPVDDQILGVAIPEKTARAAWEHLASNKDKPDIDNFIDTPSRGQTSHPVADSTETRRNVIQPFDVLPPEPPTARTDHWPLSTKPENSTKTSENKDKPKPILNSQFPVSKYQETIITQRSDSPSIETSSASAVITSEPAAVPVSESENSVGSTNICTSSSNQTNGQSQPILLTTPSTEKRSCNEENEENLRVFECSAQFQYKFK